MTNITHLGALRFITQQTELSHSNTHMNYVYVVFKFEEKDTYRGYIYKVALK